MKTNEPSSTHLVINVTGSFLETDWLMDKEALQKQAAEEIFALKKASAE